MKKTISILAEEFENEKTGERVEGITIMVDGMLKEVMDIIKSKDSKYQTTVEVIQDALMKGLEDIRQEFSE